MRVRGVVRRIGNSPGLIIPWEEVQKHKIKEGDVVELEVERRVNLREMFGAFEFSKSSQEMKDEARPSGEIFSIKLTLAFCGSMATLSNPRHRYTYPDSDLN